MEPSNKINKKSFVSILLVGGVLLVVLASYVAWNVRNKQVEIGEDTQSIQAGFVTQDAQYTPIELAQVKSYTPKFATDLIITTGTVVGIDIDRNNLLIGDGNGAYVLVTFGRAFRDVFIPIFTSLKIGDVVEVKGTPEWTTGDLINSSNGLMIQTIGFNPQTSITFGMIGLDGIKRIHTLIPDSQNN
ncbi:MAG: hypothetical protein KBD55_02575 [Candidatus Pacebacteria bacterium]|nr:hypothetical protein [Candidatus Paceibacterota bacterium]